MGNTYNEANQERLVLERLTDMNTEPTPVPTADATQMKFNHSINIQPLNRGFLVNVGCQSIAFETHEKMLKYLTEYLTNPKGFETNYRQGLVLKENY